jgi:LDH2 family malate/lactate/ureidoglycolate dehydrogenase
MLVHRVVVDESGFSIRTGVWGTSEHDMKFSNLSRIRLTKTRRTGRQQFGSNYFLECESKSGSVAQIYLNEGVYYFVVEAAMPLILENARQKGVAVVNET